MPRPIKLKPQDLQPHIELHVEKKQLSIGWHAFCAMAEAKAATSAMARIFKVSRPTMSHWLELYERLK
jgi:hypothetical protein